MRPFRPSALIFCLAAAGPAAAQPLCFVVDPPFIGDATALRVEDAGDGSFRADAETVFVWHGGVCNDCIGAGNDYPEVFATYRGIKRKQTSDGVSYTGTDFSIAATGESEITFDGGLVQKGQAFRARPFGSSRYCDGFGN